MARKGKRREGDDGEACNRGKWKWQGRGDEVGWDRTGREGRGGRKKENSKSRKWWNGWKARCKLVIVPVYDFMA